MPSRAQRDSWTWRPFCLPFLVGMTPASMTVSKFQRVEEVKVAQSCPTLCDPMDCSPLQADSLPSGPPEKPKFKSLVLSCPTLLRPRGLWPTRLLRPWDSPGKNTGVGCHFLLQGIFPTQGSNPGLPHCRQTLWSLSHQGSPREAWRAEQFLIKGEAATEPTEVRLKAPETHQD